MARQALGTKRVCPVTGRKFYDLNKDPIVSPYTGQVVTIAAPVRSRPDTAPVAHAQPEPEVELETTGDAELISLEEALNRSIEVEELKTMLEQRGLLPPQARAPMQSQR